MFAAGLDVRGGERDFMAPYHRRAIGQQDDRVDLGVVRVVRPRGDAERPVVQEIARGCGGVDANRNADPDAWDIRILPIALVVADETRSCS